MTTPTAASNMFLLKLRKQSAATLADAAVASLMSADTQRSKPAAKNILALDADLDWLALAQP